MGLHIDSSICLQQTGQVEIQTVELAQQRFDTAKRAQQAAEQEHRLAARALHRHRVRLWAARLGLPSWFYTLIGGSAATLVFSTLLIFVVQPPLTFVLLIAVLIFASFAGAIFWLLRESEGLSGAELKIFRTQAMARAMERCRSAAEVVSIKVQITDAAKRLLIALENAALSAANKHSTETNRLLRIEPGRLYPDEFESFVADIFRHLGFQLEVIGPKWRSGR